jgi:hypothetical protein
MLFHAGHAVSRLQLDGVDNVIRDRWPRHRRSKSPCTAKGNVCKGG